MSVRIWNNHHPSPLTITTEAISKAEWYHREIHLLRGKFVSLAAREPLLLISHDILCVIGLVSASVQIRVLTFIG